MKKHSSPYRGLAAFVASGLLCLQAYADVAPSGGPPPSDLPNTPVSADTPWRYVAVKSGPFCPQAAGKDPKTGAVWSGERLFSVNMQPVPPGLADFCVYTADGYPPQVEPGAAPLEALRCDFRPPPCLTELSRDSLSVATMGATPQVLENALWEDLRDHLFAQAGRFDTWSGGSAVRIAFIDTEPPGLGQDLNGPGTSLHGFTLLSIARDLLCRGGGSCGVQFSSGLGLPLVFCDTVQHPSGVCENPANGGYLGTPSQLARAVRAQVQGWQNGTPGQRLVINLSVAWERLFNEDGTGALRPATKAVLAALEDARCRGALVVAAAGNVQGGPTPPAAALLPAGWEELAMPDKTTCEGLIAGPVDDADIPPGNVYRPLVYAVSAVDTFDRPVAQRIGGQARLAAYGDHAVTDAEVGGMVGPTATQTGTSVATAVVSAAAAAVWYYRPELAGWEVIEQIYAAADELLDDGAPVAADFCFGGGSCPRARRVQICDAVAAACAGVGCPAFDCPQRNAYLPELDADQVEADFALDDTYDIEDLTEEGTVSGCGPDYTLHWLTATAPPDNPCPQRQYYSLQATPWTDGQPSGQACELCSCVARSPGTLHLEVEQDFEGELRDVTLVCGVDPLASQGTFDAYRIPTAAPLVAGDRIKIANVPPACEAEGATLAYSVAVPGRSGAVSATSTVISLTDRDGDVAKDNEDNCLLAANPAQIDSDGDAIGNRCDADIAEPNDCQVGFADLATFKDAFFTTPPSPGWNPDADLDGDGAVGFVDLGLFRDAFFGVPGPSGLPNACN